MAKLIVVIDDELPIREFVSRLLSEEGWSARAYSSALEALNDIRAGLIDPGVILLDMRMPGMDGPQFADALRLDRPEIPIVVMTAARDAQRWAIAIGAAGYLPKPFDINWLIDVVSKIAGEPEDDDSLKIVPPLTESRSPADAGLRSDDPPSTGQRRPTRRTLRFPGGMGLAGA